MFSEFGSLLSVSVFHRAITHRNLIKIFAEWRVYMYMAAWKMLNVERVGKKPSLHYIRFASNEHTNRMWWLICS